MIRLKSRYKKMKRDFRVYTILSKISMSSIRKIREEEKRKEDRLQIMRMAQIFGYSITQKIKNKRKKNQYDLKSKLIRVSKKKTYRSKNK